MEPAVSASELSALLRQAARDPLASRRALHAALLRSPTYLLHLGERPLGPGETRVVRGQDAFSLWADVEPEFEGVWVPVFTQRKNVSAYISARAIKPPPGREFQWMRHGPGKVYGLLQGIQRFAGILLDPDGPASVRLDWPEVNALSEGRLPAEAPVLCALPLAAYRPPEGAQCVFGPLPEAARAAQGRCVLFPEAGSPSPQDYRRLVRLDLGSEGAAWTPCRHLAAALRSFSQRGGGEAAHLEALGRCLLEFELFGEAEAFCMRLLEGGEQKAYARALLAVAFRRTGRLAQCIETCQRGIRENPQEKSFYLNQALAHAQLEEMSAAREVAKEGLRLFPGEEALQRFL